MAEGEEEIEDIVPPSSGNGKIFAGRAIGLLLGGAGGFAGSHFMGGAEAAIVVAFYFWERADGVHGLELPRGKGLPKK